MRWLGRIGPIALFLLLAMAFLFGGWLLPREWSVEESAVIEEPAGAVAALVRDLPRWPRWTVWNRRSLPDLAAVKATVDAVRWESRSTGPFAIEVDRAKGSASDTLAYRLRFERTGQVFEGQIRVDAAGARAGSGERREPGDGSEPGVQTRVTWRVAGKLPASPLRRWIGWALVRTTIRSDIRESLDALKEYLERE